MGRLVLHSFPFVHIRLVQQSSLVLLIKSTLVSYYFLQPPHKIVLNWSQIFRITVIRFMQMILIFLAFKCDMFLFHF